jgi:hypothetical protein
LKRWETNGEPCPAPGGSPATYDADRTPFTIGICEAGVLYIRNDERGDSAHRAMDSNTDLETIGQAIADLIGHLY